MRSEPASGDALCHWTLTRTIAQALSDAGIPAIDGAELLGCLQGGTVEDASDGRAIILWDVAFLDPKVRMKDYRRLLVTRFPDSLPRATLVRNVVELLRSLKDQGAPMNVVVLEPMSRAIEAKSLVRKPRRAA